MFGARVGIDVQHPFADRDLVDFVITLPHAVKASTARIKPLLRDALADLSRKLLLSGTTRPTSHRDRPLESTSTRAIAGIRDSGVRLPDLDYGRLFRDARRPVNDRVFWTRLTSAHVFLAGSRA